jgi:hypothetical protein
LAKKIRMDFPAGWLLPRKVIVTVSFNTEHYGYSPTGAVDRILTSVRVRSRGRIDREDAGRHDG